MVAAVTIGWSLATNQSTLSMLGTWSLLVALALVQGELSRIIERTRRRFSGTLHVNMTSVWVFAGVLLLPIGWVGLLVVVLYCHLRIRSWYRMQGVRPYRMTVAAAAIVLSALAAKAVLLCGGVTDISAIEDRSSTAFAIVLAAVVVFFVVDAVLIAAAAKLEQPANRLVDVLGSAGDNALELATICLGAMAAIMLSHQPVSVVLVYVPLFVLHRSVLVRQLEESASKDLKTGLLNAATWHGLAQKEIERARRHRDTVGVLMVDLDHFKCVNDTYGHLAGDEVLKATSRLLRTEVREYGVSGRFGGEEFAVLLPSTTPAESLAVAERIRHQISELTVDVPVADGTAVITGLSASIGVAIYPHSGDTLEQLLFIADGALYKAKNSGRNRVVGLAS
ncbi:GGDEF domain-containing protein [Goodfellowiella coeruleoviolacea]|uniref:GGDEF domain-containing protein n=1 Tax=Goodfellowiella coeruleoviolacea TaxID=334858 RepID=UPI0020A24021|nr:GGDEF domain-containing protein [Goodfellowiella coeruleoviolacea]